MLLPEYPPEDFVYFYDYYAPAISTVSFKNQGLLPHLLLPGFCECNAHADSRCSLPYSSFLITYCNYIRFLHLCSPHDLKDFLKENMPHLTYPPAHSAHWCLHIHNHHSDLHITCPQHNFFQFPNYCHDIPSFCKTPLSIPPINIPLLYFTLCYSEIQTHLTPIFLSTIFNYGLIKNLSSNHMKFSGSLSSHYNRAFTKCRCPYSINDSNSSSDQSSFGITEISSLCFLTILTGSIVLS